MHITFVNNQAQLGGAETVIDQLRRGARRAGHHHSLHVADGKSYPADITPMYPRLLSRLGHSRLHSVVEQCLPRQTWTDRAFRKLADINTDLIHLHNFHGIYATTESLAHVIRRKPVIWTFHAFWGITGGCDHPRDCSRYQEQCGRCPQLGQWPLGQIDNTEQQLRAKLNLLSRQPLNIIAPSRFLADKVKASQIGRHWHVHHIPNGVDPARFRAERKQLPDFRASIGLSRNPAKPAILVVNRDFKNPLKGFNIVARALQLTPPSQPLQVILAGENSSWAATQLPAHITPVETGYVPSRSHLAQLYEASDIFLFASEAENFPCVILEAMSARCCVVATPTGGVPEQINHGQSGFLSTTLSGEDLALALQSALANPSLQQTCARNARNRIFREFSEEVMVHRHLKLYNETLTHPPRLATPTGGKPSLDLAASR